MKFPAFFRVLYFYSALPAMFSCNYFKIRSGNYKGSAVLEVKDAYNWKNSSSESELPNRLTKSDKKYL